jgi:putative Mn2+ efflux pump MntP
VGNETEMCEAAMVFALCLHFVTCLVGYGLQSYACTYVVFRAQYGGTVLILNVGIRLPDSVPMYSAVKT